MYDEHTKEYIGEVEAQIDPLESELKEEEIYLLPANSTFDEPIEEQEGFKIVFDGEKWISEEIPQPEKEVEDKPLTNEDVELIRASLYRSEVDPLMSEYNRKKIFNLFAEGEEEALLAEIEAKVEEIKARYPYTA